MKFPAGPASLGADESGILDDTFLIICGLVTSAGAIYTTVFLVMTVCCEQRFFDWVDMHFPFYWVLFVMELAAVLPVAIVAGVSIFLVCPCGLAVLCT